jgi:dTDP-L-rhamnose 4-epimerase
MVVASSMSIYGEGAYHCPDHGCVYPRIRPVAQLQRREWELRCPIPGCGRVAESRPTSEDKPLSPTSVYAINKRDHEELFLTVGMAYGVATTALRYFNVYGTRQALSNPYTGVAAIFCSRLLNEKSPVIFEDGGQQRDFTHVSDIVQANLLAMDDPRTDFAAYNVGSGQALTVLEVAQVLAAEMNTRPSRQEQPGFPTEDRNTEPEITGQFRAGDIRHCYGDIGKLAALGYRPGVRFEQGVAELVAWVQQQVTAQNFEKARGELLARGLSG